MLKGSGDWERRSELNRRHPMGEPISNGIIGALANFTQGGSGPEHRKLTQVFVSCGCSDADPFDEITRTPNKVERIIAVGRAALRRPDAGRKFTEGLIDQFRISNVFGSERQFYENSIKILTDELKHVGWSLTSDGHLQLPDKIDLETGGRPALEEQINRLRRNEEDPGALLGTAKDTIESACKLVLEDNHRCPGANASFSAILAQTFEVLDMKAGGVDTEQPGGKSLRTIYSSSQKIAGEINNLRNAQGSGHGRTLPTGVSVEAARYVVKQAILLTELILSTHERRMGAARS
jgi:hypothetical protein